MLALLAEGDIEGAVSLWALRSGREVPEALRIMQTAYARTNQTAGPCIKVARAIHAGFQEMGGKAQFIRFTPPGELRYLGWEVEAGVPKSTLQISSNGVHYAVQLGERIYDAFTGPRGLAVQDYLKRLFAPGGPPVMQVMEQIAEAP